MMPIPGKPVHAPLALLLVEDSYLNVRVCRSILEGLGHAVAVAANGREAVRMWANGRFDAILMDLQMPVLDGREAAREIRERERARGTGERVPVIALTAHAAHDPREGLPGDDFDGLVPKPATPAGLARELARLVPPKGDAPER